MGFYKYTVIFYGCPIATKMEKLTDKLKGISTDEKVEKGLMTIVLKENYLTLENAVFIVVPRTHKTIQGEIDNNDIANGYVKISEVESILKITKDDITPTKEENEIFTKYINKLVKDENKKEMNEKIGYYIAQIDYSTLEFPIQYYLSRLLPINMEK